jgi:hypothetical protein
MDLAPSSSDREPAIEMKPTDADRQTSASSWPNVSGGQLLKALMPAALMLMAIFWINASHLFGIFHHQGAYTHRAKVALADFDRGDFGEALRLSAAANNGSYGYPTYVNIDTTHSSTVP